MEAPKDKAELLKTLGTSHDEWEAVLAEVGEARMEEPGVEGEWRVKDVVVHVGWYERAVARLLRSRSMLPPHASDLWATPTDARNAILFKSNYMRSPESVLAEEMADFAALLSAAHALSDHDLIDPAAYTGMPPDWQPWQVIAENSYAHYPEHVASIRAWLTQPAPDPGLEE